MNKKREPLCWRAEQLKVQTRTMTTALALIIAQAVSTMTRELRVCVAVLRFNPCFS